MISRTESQGAAFPCAINAWNQNQSELRKWLDRQCHDSALSEDILQEVFIRVMVQNEKFCEVSNTRAWMFRVARNLLIDNHRKPGTEPIDNQREHESYEEAPEAVDLLALSCVPRVISELDPSDREIITLCDIRGCSQKQYALDNGLSLAATKSRIRRAREKLKQSIESSCRVKFDENQKVCCFTPRDKN